MPSGRNDAEHGRCERVVGFVDAGADESILVPNSGFAANIPPLTRLVSLETTVTGNFKETLDFWERENVKK